MKTCPDCGHSVKDSHGRCVKCGAEVPEPGPPAAEPPREGPVARARERAAVLRELLPTRKALDALLPPPTGWILGIGLPAIVALMLVHGLALPETHEEEAAKAAAGQDAAVESRFQSCLSRARAKAELECGGIVGTAAGIRRMTCTAARLSADYTRCTASHTGRLGACLARCGQEARSCSSACAITGGPDPDWTDTARCLLPCWAQHLTGCASSCFRSGGDDPRRPPDDSTL
ncbi:MAG: hypothetical protein RBU30_01025 [Polyangia bacterium]|jgi:hypothetical protein|nr:hypothetical protein [Polyangia bacterium]